MKEDVQKKKVLVFSKGGDGLLRYQGRLCVPNVEGLRDRILAEAHNARYSIHPGATKMYRDLREIYWLGGMKKYMRSLCLDAQIASKLRLSTKDLVV